MSMSELSKLPALDSGRSPGQHLLKIKSTARGWLAGVLVIGSLEGWNMPPIDMQQLTLDLHIYYSVEHAQKGLLLPICI